MSKSKKGREPSTFVMFILAAVFVYGSIWVAFLVLGSLWLGAYLLKQPTPDISLTNVLIGSVLVIITFLFIGLSQGVRKLEQELKESNERLKALHEEVEREP